MNDLVRFHRELIAEVQGNADACGLISVEAFFEKVVELLTEAGEIDSPSRAFFEAGGPTLPMRIDGYGGDPRDCDGVLSLILCDFELGDEVRRQNKEVIQRLLQRLYRFFRMSFKEEFRYSLEETSPGFQLADLISGRWQDVEKVKLIIVTNGDYRARADADKMLEHEGRPVTSSVWDLKRLKQYMEQGQTRENLVIDFEGGFGGGLPVLQIAGGGGSLESYLAVIKGKQLADIYEKWGPRLLEANVRSFLQARGKVNQGIRNTIRDEPKYFFSYNNGVSATADAVEVRRTSRGLELVSADNLQIVNGGQTTASLHAARKTAAAQLENVRVQMKVTVAPEDSSMDLVSKISLYANSQNKVNSDDFSSNRPFHVRVEELSRKVLARGEGGYKDSKWFYERARGQYANERSRKAGAEQRKFDSEYPRSQMFTKTDLAKIENTWAGIPHIVSCGAQKNFGEFATGLDARYAKEIQNFNELWFRRMIGRLIVFRAMEKIVSAAEWYEGGYRANIVTYGIAKLVHDVAQDGMAVDLDRVWKEQQISVALRTGLSVVGQGAQGIILNPHEGVRNNSEWAKKQACWMALKRKKLTYPSGVKNALVTLGQAAENEKEARSEEVLDAGIQVQTKVVEYGGDFWTRVLHWAREEQLVSPREEGILNICASIPRRVPTEKQCAAALQILGKVRDEGFE